MNAKETLEERFNECLIDYPCNPTRVECCNRKYHFGYNADGLIEKYEVIEFMEDTKSWETILLEEYAYNKKGKIVSHNQRKSIKWEDGALSDDIENRVYSYNENGRVLEITSEVSGYWEADNQLKAGFTRKTNFNALGLPAETKVGEFDELGNITYLHEHLFYKHDGKGNLIEEITKQYYTAHENEESCKTWSYDAQNREISKSSFLYDTEDEAWAEIQLSTSYDEFGNISLLTLSVKYENVNRWIVAQKLEFVRNASGQLLECTLRIQSDTITPETNYAVALKKDKKFVFVYDEKHLRPIQQNYYTYREYISDWDLIREYTISYDAEM